MLFSSLPSSHHKTNGAIAPFFHTLSLSDIINIQPHTTKSKMPIPSFAAVYSSLAVILLAVLSNARDLRPSEHGLEYQNPGAMENSSPQMQSFFKGNSWSSSDVALPKAMNTSLPPQWWNRSHRNRSGAAADGGGGDHIRGALLVASLVCGIIGVSLLVASAFIYFFKFRKQNRSSSSLSVSETTNIIANK